MNILIFGSGGREHAMCKSLLQDKTVKLYCISEDINPFIKSIVIEYLLIEIVDKNMNILKYCIKNWNIDYVVIGPEKYLERKIVDILEPLVPCIGPRYNHAKIETDKSFARQLLFENGFDDYLPRFHIITNFKEIDVINSFTEDYVVKPSGLSSGKGVKLSGEHLKDKKDGIHYCKQILSEGNSVVLEQKLFGQEFSLMSFCDGKNIKHMPLVQDYKRLNDGDKGPNTGSMGSISYSNHSLPFLSEEDLKTAQELNFVVTHLLKKINNDNGYKGILYGSYIKTLDGIKIIEYNARFGDPECINVLHLLDNTICNLNSIFKSIIHQNLDTINIKFKNENTVCKYLVPKEYPIKKTILPINIPILNYYISGVTMINNNLYTTGSRILAMIESGDFEDSSNLINKNYDKFFQNYHWRKDIGDTNITYKKSGVNIDEGNKCVKLMKPYIQNTYNQYSENNFGDFGGLFNLGEYLDRYKYQNPILVSSTDGVGTKTRFMNKYGGVNTLKNLGIDIVNHCINDILVKGAKPLYFLDYLAYHRLESKHATNIVQGMSEACKKSNCIIIGGETAEMPGVYRDLEFDIAGTITGIVDKNNVIDGKKNIKEGNIVLALPSNGLHTNGYSLVLKLLEKFTPPNDLMDYLCRPHKSYLDEIISLNEKINILGLCHITGGGLIDNPERILPKGLNMKINKKSWVLPKIYKWIQIFGKLEMNEMYRVFNCGIGMLIVIDKNDIDKSMEIIYKYGGFVIGEIQNYK